MTCIIHTNYIQSVTRKYYEIYLNSVSESEGACCPRQKQDTINDPNEGHQCEKGANPTNFNWDIFLSLSLKTSPSFGPEPHSVTFGNIVLHVYQNQPNN